MILPLVHCRWPLFLGKSKAYSYKKLHPRSKFGYFSKMTTEQIVSTRYFYSSSYPLKPKGHNFLRSTLYHDSI